MKKYCLILCIFSLAANTFASTQAIPLKKGMSYQIATAELRREGWSARTMHVKSEFTFIGIENTLLIHGVKGIESCAVDRPVCILHYTKRNRCLRIITWGEEFNELKVDNWDRQCPTKDAL